MPNYTAEHARAGVHARLPRLETWPNQFPGYTITTRHHALCRIHLGLPEDRASGLRHHHDSISAEETLPRAEGLENVPAGVSQPRNLLRKRRQPHLARYRGSHQAGLVRCSRRIHSPRWPDYQRRSPLAAPDGLPLMRNTPILFAGGQTSLPREIILHRLNRAIPRPWEEI